MGPNPANGELRRKIEEYKAREDIYVAALIGQEAEMSQLRHMASDVLGAYGDLSRAAVRGALVEPAQNMEVLMLRQKAREKEQQVSQLREELEANRFDQKLPSGQTLMKKCKALLTENRELGKEIREERLAELSAAVVAERRQNELLLQKCSEATEFCAELSQENDKLQGTIAKVAGRLREARTELDGLRKERAEAKAKRKREREQQKKAGSGQAPAPDPHDDQVSVPTEPVVAAPSAPAVEVPTVTVVVPLAAPAVTEASAPAVPPAAAGDAAIGAATLEAAAAGDQRAEKERKEKKKRKTEAAEEATPKDKKEKKRRKAEKAAAVAAAIGRAAAQPS